MCLCVSVCEREVSRETEREQNELMHRAQLYNEATAENTTLKIFYVIMRSVNISQFHYETVAGQITLAGQHSPGN